MNKAWKTLVAAAFFFTVSKMVSDASTRTFNFGNANQAATPTPGGVDFQGNQKVADLYGQGVTATQAGDLKKALASFDQANRIQPNNPDILNMLAHSQRKLDAGDDVMLDAAMENYWKALRIKPDFPEAREYMGETYLMALLEQIGKLKGEGVEGREQLEDLTQAFLEAAEKVKTAEKDKN